jgi:beta-N-acetylhexosaminidase
VSLQREASVERLAAGLLVAGFPSTALEEETKELIASGVRNFILFGRNLVGRGAVPPPEQIRSLTAELQDLVGGDALIAIDHEGGRVNRLRHVATGWPSPMGWAAAGDQALARRASRSVARELASFGVNLNFAPVADVLADHRNPALGTRCFSDDPQMVAAFVTAFIQGHHDAGVGTAAKHFPGHGGTPVDSHLDLPYVDYDIAHLRENDLVPFRVAVEADVDCLMVSHVWYSCLNAEPTPATISPSVVRLARADLRFDGALVTDSLEMDAIRAHATVAEAAVKAALAGCDLVAICHEARDQREAIAALVEAVRQGRLPIERLVEANRRLGRLRSRVRATRDEAAGDGAEVAREIARRAVTLVRDSGGFLPLRLRSDALLGVVTFSPSLLTQVESAASNPPLVDAARKYHGRVIDLTVGDVAGEIGSAVQQMRDTDVILVGTSFTTGRPGQAEVVKALLETAKPVVVLALRDPFDLLAFPEAPCFLAAYDDTGLSADAALAVIFGKEEPRGRLPVALPGLYPRGHGLTAHRV